MSFVGSPEYMSPEILLGSGYDYSVDYYTMGVLLYEMLVGLPPHYNEDKMQMYKDITMKEPVIPSVLQGSARDILERLLKISPAERLGMGEGGIQEIKDHPFFKEINWEAIKAKGVQPGRKRLPLEVNILESNFDKQYTRLPISINVAQEELIKINEPIELRPQTRKRSHSITFKPQLRSRKVTRQQSILRKQQKLYGQTIIGCTNAQNGGGAGQRDSTLRLLAKQKIHKTRSMHIKRSGRGGIPPSGYVMNKVGSQEQCRAIEEQKRTLNRQTNSNQIIAPDISYGDSAIEPHQHVLRKHTDPFQLGGASTLEFLSSVQASGIDNKHSQSLLDVFTQFSVGGPGGGLTDDRNRELADNSDLAAAPLRQPAYILNTPQENTSLRFSNPHGQQQQQYIKALSPFTPMERGNTKAGQVIKLQHGFSEYNQRGPNERGPKNNNTQDSAFNYRKQTLGEEEIEVGIEQIDLNSQTEFNQLTASGDAEMIMISATPYQQNMTSPSGVANESIQPFDRTPKNFLAQTYVQGYLSAQGQVNMVQLDKPTGLSASVDASAVRKIFERVTGERVLEEEVDEYMVKGLPTTVTIAGLGAHLKSSFQNNNIRDVSRFPSGGSFLKGSIQTHTPTEQTYLVSNLGSWVNKVQENYSGQVTPEIQIIPATPEILLSADMSKEISKVSFNAYSSFRAGQQLEENKHDFLNIDAQLDDRQKRPELDSFGTDSSSDRRSGRMETTSLESLFVDSIDENNDMSISEKRQKNLIDQQKIQVMQKIKSKKLKKRLSENNGDHGEYNDCLSPKGDSSHQVLHYEYGYSVEQQRDKVDNVMTLNRVLFNSGMRGVSRHQSSQNISNLIAKSVIGMTPRVISKVASKEHLPDLPESRPPFESNKNKTGFQQQTQRLLTFTEKAAGVVSERNRKFQKPQTLKNLQQKLLQADDDDCIGIDEEDFEVSRMTPERVTLQIPASLSGSKAHKAAVQQYEMAGDLQLQYNSELISINEFESRGEEDNKQLQSSTLGADIIDSSSGDEEQKSPILVFQSQSMADITSPRGKTTRQEHQVVHNNLGIRESMSSPDIMKNECSSAKRYIEEYLVMSSRNKDYGQPQTVNVPAHHYPSKIKKSTNSKSPSQTQMRMLDRMFTSQTKSNLSGKNPAVATSLANNTSQDNLLCSPLRKSFNHKKHGRDFGVPITSVRMGGGTQSSQNMSLQHSDFHSSSKKASMIVTSSPYTSVKTKAKKKGGKSDKLRLNGAASKKTNTTHSHIHRQSGFGTMIELDSGSKKSSNKKDSSYFAGSSQKTAPIMSVGGKRGSLTLLTTPYHPTASNTKSPNNYKIQSAGKTTKAANASGKITAAPHNHPKQPSMITSPVQQIESGDKLTLSLRVLQTPAAFTKGGAPSIGPIKEESKPNSGLDIMNFVSPQNSRSLRQKYGGSALTLGGVQSYKAKNSGNNLHSKVLSRNSLKNGSESKLATVSSRRSFHSQGKSSRRKHRHSKSSFVQQQQNGTVDDNSIPLLCETTPKEDKEAYDQWKEAPMPSSMSKPRNSVQLPRSNSAAHRMATLPPTGRQNQKKNSVVHPSIFNVVDDIMLPIVKANLQVAAPYGTSKSPEVALRKSEMSGSQRFGLLLYDSPRAQPFSNQSALRSSSRKTIGKKSRTTTNLGRLIKQHNVAFAQTSTLQKNGAGESADMPSKKDYNLQLVPKEPQDISNVFQTGPEELDSEDCIHLGHNEVMYQDGLKKTDILTSTSNLMDSQCHINQVDNSAHAIQMHKQKTPFKKRLLQQQYLGVTLNETSVEVLKLDGSEFTFSDRDVTKTKSNLMSLKSEDFIGSEVQSQKQLQLGGGGLNSTYQQASSPSRAQMQFVRGNQPKQGVVLSADDCVPASQFSGVTTSVQLKDQPKTSVSKEQQQMYTSTPASESIPSESFSPRYQHLTDINKYEDAENNSQTVYGDPSNADVMDPLYNMRVKRIDSEEPVQTTDCLLSADSCASLGRSIAAGGRKHPLQLISNEESREYILAQNKNKMPIAKHPRQAQPKSGSFVSIISSQKLTGKQSTKKNRGKKGNPAKSTKHQAYKKSKKSVRNNPSVITTSHQMSKEMTSNGGNSNRAQQLPLQSCKSSKPSNSSLRLKAVTAGADDFYCATEQQIALRHHDLQSKHRKIVSMHSRHFSVNSTQNNLVGGEDEDDEDDLNERQTIDAGKIANLSVQDMDGDQTGRDWSMQDKTNGVTTRSDRSTFCKASNSQTLTTLRMQESSSHQKIGFIRLVSGKGSVGNYSAQSASRKQPDKIAKAAQKPRSPQAKYTMPQVGFPKKVSVILTGNGGVPQQPMQQLTNKSRSVPRMKMINRTQTNTPVPTRNTDRCFTLKDLNSSSSLRMPKMATATHASERLGSVGGLSQERQSIDHNDITSPQSKISLKLCLTGPLSSRNKPKSQQRSHKAMTTTLKLTQL